MNLQKIKERCAKATPGPWDYDCGDNSIYSMTCFDDGGCQQSVSSLFEEKSIISDDDAEFIAHAREDIPALVDGNERLEALNRELRDANKRLTDKLAAYEQAERDGLLVRLPCKVGDTIYWLCEYGDGTFDNEVYESEVHEIAVRKDDAGYSFVIDGNEWLSWDFGKTAFLTREEAEAALKSLS